MCIYAKRVAEAEAWLRKTTYCSDINIMELDAVLKDINLLKSRLIQPLYLGEWVTSRVTNKMWVQMKGATEILVKSYLRMLDE